MNAKILLVEDDASARQSFAYLLQYANYQVCEAANGETAVERLQNDVFDVVIADIILTGSDGSGSLNGMDVMHIARQQPYRPEVIIVTGYGSLDTAIHALQEGAIDYLLKPCSGEQLRAAVERALYRSRKYQRMRMAAEALATVLEYDGVRSYSHSKPARQQPFLPISREFPAETLTLGKLIVGTTRREVSFDGKVVHLTSIEYLVLRYLAHYVGRVCTSSDIVRFVHGTDTPDSEARALIKPHIHNLRKKLPASLFMTERGIGYRLLLPDDYQP